LYLSSLVFATIKHEKCKLIVDFMEFSEVYCAVFNFPKKSLTSAQAFTKWSNKVEVLLEGPQNFAESPP
jgi:hypothetical protein